MDVVDEGSIIGAEKFVDDFELLDFEDCVSAFGERGEGRCEALAEVAVVVVGMVERVLDGIVEVNEELGIAESGQWRH